MPNNKQEVITQFREVVAGKIIVDCGYDSEYPCPHAHPTMGYEKCPHEDKDICMWQLEQADEILSTVIDGKCLAIVDMKGELPENEYEPPLDDTLELWRDIVDATYNRIKNAGFTHKVVAVLGEK